MEVYIGRREGMVEIDPQGQADFIEEYLSSGAPEFGPLFYLCNMALRFLALVFKRKPFSSLDLQEKQALVNRINASRNPALRGITYLLGMPIFMSYYRRREVALPLGFDAQALKEESELRTVRRDRDLPPKEEPS